MYHQNSCIDLSGELMLQRHGCGVTLVHPDQCKQKSHTVNDILQLPVNSYFIDLDSNIHEINHVATEICSFTSKQDAIGRSVREYANKATASKIIENDKKIFASGKFDLTEDTMMRADDYSFSALAFRYPWYVNNKLAGLMGIAIVHSHRDPQYLVDSLLLLGKMGLVGAMSQDYSAVLQQPDMKYYTRREIEIISRVLQGKTAKNIGVDLNISKRTVEHHIENIKSKSGCRTKYELFAKFSGQFRL